MTFIDDHMAELIARYAAEDNCAPEEWEDRAVRSVVRQRYELETALAESRAKTGPPPSVGSRWIWERDQPHARETITVEQAKWNGEEWWILCRADSNREAYWNDLGRFREACTQL